jgi:hypothetical protein
MAISRATSLRHEPVRNDDKERSSFLTIHVRLQSLFQEVELPVNDDVSELTWRYVRDGNFRIDS